MANDTRPALTPDGDDSLGQRARMIRRRRGLSLKTAADLTGISKSYLSMLETGAKSFGRRGLIEDLANALGCAVADITGQPYTTPDREGTLAKAVVRQIERGLDEATLDDVPDQAPIALDELARWVDSAAQKRDSALYRPAGDGIDTALIDLQIHVATGAEPDRRRAAALLTQAAYHAFVLATTFGYLHLAQQAALRASEAARVAEQPELEAFAMFARAPSVARTGGRGRAIRILDGAISEAEPLTVIRDEDTLGAETFGLLHLMGAHFAARNRDPDTAGEHLREARQVAAITGERNGLRQHFGPTNVAVWQVAVGAELGQPEAAERVENEPIAVELLGSADRHAALHFDLARCNAHAGGNRDVQALRHLDMADRLAPQRIRNDPIARDIALGLRRRARRRVWELDSLLRRFGVA